jgi:lipid A 4'-phosphatase
MSKMTNPLWWLLPVTLFALITPFTPSWDMAIARYFYQKGQFMTTPFYDFVFQYASYPAFAVAFSALMPLFVPCLKKWRAASGVLLLSMALGAGLITHTLLKDRWGRPRPRQLMEFGGHQPFRPYYLPNFFHQPEPSKSFPCGHCTMGFYFFALGLVCQRRGLRYLSYAIAVALGLLLGFTRMAQGGHFLSDVLASALIMWLVAGLLVRLFKP